MSGPLKGLRVLDLTRILAGPWCTQMLGDLGAEVIKIEHPDVGDDTRRWGPPWVPDQSGNETGEATYFFSTNRNKSSVTVNLKDPRGVDLVRRMALECDILVENFKVGGLSKLGLGYEDLKDIAPGLIYVSITGFGQTGPMASQPGYDYLIQGMGGLMSITGEADDMPGGGPQRVGVAICDINTGFYATIGVLAALHHRHQSGKGQYIDLALLDSQVGWLVNQAASYLVGGVVPQRTGKVHPSLVPYQPFATADGAVIIAVGNDRQFQSLCSFVGHEELGIDERFASNGKRVGNRTVLVPMLEDITRLRTSAYWLENLPKNGVPCSRINRIDEVFEEPQVMAREMKIELEHPVAGTVQGVGNPLKFSETPVEYRTAPPVHGGSTRDVLERVLGMDTAEIDNLHSDGVV